MSGATTPRAFTVIRLTGDSARRPDAVDAEIEATTPRRAGSAAWRVRTLRSRSISSFRDESFDICVGARDVGLRLVEVVVGDQSTRTRSWGRIPGTRPELSRQRPCSVRARASDACCSAMTLAIVKVLTRPGHRRAGSARADPRQPAIERPDGGGLITGRCEGASKLQGGHSSSLVAVPPRRIRPQTTAA